MIAKSPFRHNLYPCITERREESMRPRDPAERDVTFRRLCFDDHPSIHLEQSRRACPTARARGNLRQRRGGASHHHIRTYQCAHRLAQSSRRQKLVFQIAISKQNDVEIAMQLPMLEAVVE